MKYTSVSCNGLDQKGTDKMILEKQVGVEKPHKCWALRVQLIPGVQAAVPGLFQKMEGEPSLLYYNWDSSPGTCYQQGQRWWRGDEAN